MEKDTDITPDAHRLMGEIFDLKQRLKLNPNLAPEIESKIKETQLKLEQEKQLKIKKNLEFNNETQKYQGEVDRLSVNFDPSNIGFAELMEIINVSATVQNIARYYLSKKIKLIRPIKGGSNKSRKTKRRRSIKTKHRRHRKTKSRK